jgi:uncharacterized protein YdaU (DUF1376 family)
MAKAAPYFPFYPDDWLDDEYIFDMGLECEGAYIRLLSAMWKRGGKIPDKEAWICNVLRCKPAKWRKIKQVLVHQTGVIKLENGCLFNQRLTEELNVLIKKSEKCSENASKRWNKEVKNGGKKHNKINESNNAVALRSVSHTDTDTDTDTDINNISTEHTSSAQDVDEDFVIELPLNKKDESHHVKENDIDEYKSLYPAVDVMQELRNMRGWLISNPAKRKTKNGISRFINSWLSRKQDQGRLNNNQAGNYQKPTEVRQHYSPALKRVI